MQKIFSGYVTATFSISYIGFLLYRVFFKSTSKKKRNVTKKWSFVLSIYFDNVCLVWWLERSVSQLKTLAFFYLVNFAVEAGDFILRLGVVKHGKAFLIW